MLSTPITSSEEVVTAARPPAASLVVGYNVSHSGDEALDFAADLAARLTADLHIVHIIDLADVQVEPESGYWTERGQKLVASVRRHAMRRINTVAYASFTEAVTGDPVDVLDKAVHERAAMMLVVGTDQPPHNMLRRLFWHDLSKLLIRRLSCPVIVVPGHQHH